MTRSRWSLVGLVVCSVGVSVGCGNDVPAPVATEAGDHAPAALTHTVALAVEGMT